MQENNVLLSHYLVSGKELDKTLMHSKIISNP